VSIIAVEIGECQNGYARVSAIPDNSKCVRGGGGSCYQPEQVFLKAVADQWVYLTNGSGIACATIASQPLGPDLLAACEALGLRTPDAGTTAPPPINVTRVAGVTGRGVAATNGAIWTTVEPAAGSNGSIVARWGVERRDPRTGSVLQTITVPGVVREVAAGAGLVWVIGGGDGAYPQGGVAAIDPATGRVAFTYGWEAGPPIAPYGIAVTTDAAWVTDTAGRVLRFRPSSSGFGVSVSGPVTGRPTTIVALSDGSIWVSRSLDGVISRIDPTSLQVTETRPWSGVLFAADGTTIWTTDGTRLIQLDPELLGTGLSVAEGTRIPVDPVAVAVGAAGLVVAISGGGIDRYSRPVLSGSSPQPTGPITTDGSVEPWSLASLGADVWFIDDNGLGHWAA